LRLLLEQQPAVCHVSELGTGHQLLTELERAAADVLLVDAHLPDLDLLRVLPSIRQVYPRLRVVVLSSRPEERDGVLTAGADAFVSKGDPPQGLWSILSFPASGQ
jgi:DNA-binding NarL/FixJ family response regulator